MRRCGSRGWGRGKTDNSFEGTAGGLFKSTDGGKTWRKLSNGLPDDLAQINVAIAASEPSRLYATVATTKPTAYATGDGLGFFRSDDGGENWARITTDARPAMKIGGGDLPVVRVDPKNADVVYSASIVTVKSHDGGKTWMSLRGAPGGDDYQNMWINPNDPKIILLVADQGAIVTVNGGETWSSWYNQPTAQLYHVSTTNDFPYKVCGAQQESGSVCISDRGNDGEITFRDWHAVGVIEYGYVAPDPLDADIVYGGGRNEVSRFHWSTGQVENVTPIPVRGKYRMDRTEPLMFSPVDPHLLYYAANLLFATKDGGRTWQAISDDLTRENPGMPASIGDQASLNPKVEKQRGVIYSLAPSFHDVNVLWAGTDDGLVWRSSEGGKNWKDITPPGLTAWSKVTQISASRFDDDTAYISVSRFRIDDLRPYIYRTHDGGRSWQEIVSGLPQNAPVNTVQEDPVRKGLLFAGTENSVWVSVDDGENWQSLQLNLPHTSMRDLTVHGDDLIVATHGRSFWILDDITPLRQMSAAVASAAVHLFDPAPAYRVRRDTNTDTPLPADEPAGENPPDGAVIDYSLANAASGPVTLEILDAQGKIVRRYSSVDPPERSTEELEKELIPHYWLRGTKTLATEAGMHRWIWDLRYATPASTTHEYPIAAVPHDTPWYPLGPLVLPGQYTVRLTVNGQSYTAPITVRMDPRVKTSPADLRKQLDLEMQLASAMTQGAQAMSQARSVREQLENLTKSTKGDLAESIENFDHEVAAIQGTADKPGLTAADEAVNALYKDVEKADVAPTEAQAKASAKTQNELKAAVEGWEEVKAKAMPEINRRLRGAGWPELRLDLAPSQEAGGVDED